MATDSDIIKDALEQFQAAVDAEKDNRVLALEDKKFAKIGGKEQWPEKVWQDRETEGRPCLTINRMPQFLKQVINDQRMNKPSITVRPVDDRGDPMIAKIFQGLIRNIEVSSNADRAYDMAFDDAVTMGFGFFRITTEYAHDSTFEQDIKIKGVENAFTIYLDPEDLFNPQFAFVSEMVDRKVFKAKYGQEPRAVPSGGVGEAMEKWYDKDKVRVAEYWRVSSRRKTLLLLSDAMGHPVSTVYADKLNQALMQQMGLVVARERAVECPYVQQYMMTGQELVGDPADWAGKWIPIIPVIGECINIEGKRHTQGLIRHAKDPQRNFNYWRTAATETVALAPLAPWVGAKGQFDSDSDKWATANKKPHAYLQYDPIVALENGEEVPVAPPQRQPMAGVPAGALQEAMNASDDMKSVMGLYDASLGARSNETSGRAIMARQREGDVSTFNFMDSFARDSLTHAGRILIDLIPKIYDTARVIRVIGPNDEPTTVKINQMFMGPQGQPVNFDLSTGKYDVVVKVGPSYTTQREEVRDAVLELIRVFPPAAPVVGPLLVKNMDFPDAEKVAQQLQALMPPQAQGENPEMQQARAAIEQLQRKLGALEEDQSIEHRKVAVDEYKAETDRMQVIAPALSPQDIQAIVVQTLQDLLGGGAPPGMDMGGQIPPGPPMAPQMDPGGPPMGMPQQQVPPQAPPGAFSSPVA